MNMRAVGIACCLVVAVLGFAALKVAAQVRTGTLTIRYIDTEGGQSTLFVGPTGESLLVDTDAGRWLLAGQASNSIWQFSSEAFAERLAAEGVDTVGTFPEWMVHVREWGVERAYFAHDLMVWHRDPGDWGRPTPI